MEQLYGVVIDRRIEYELTIVTDEIFFDSYESYKTWLKWYEENVLSKTSLECIRKKGKAYFNKRGILRVGRR